MGLIDFFKGRIFRQREPPKFYVASDEAGDPLFSDDIVSAILTELEHRRSERAPYELQWTLNADFVAGHQNTDIDIVRKCITIEDPTARDQDERRVYNRIAPLMDTRLANLMTVHYDMDVKPRTGEAEDAAKAQISTKLLQYCQAVTNFDDKITRLLQWSEICGTAFGVSYWDKNSGAVIAEVEISSGDGEEPVKQQVRLGDVAFGLLSPYEVFPSSLTVQDVEDQHDVITEQIFDVDTVKSVWGVSVDGESVESYTISPEPNGITGHGHKNVTFGVRRTTRDNAVRVVTYYQKPDANHRDGLMIVVVKDRIVFYGDLPCGEIPLVAFKSRDVPGLFFGKSPVESLIPLQRSYNEIQNKIMDYVHVIVNAPLMAPLGSIDMDEIAANGGVGAGDVVEYDASRGTPRYLEYAQFPPILTQQRDQIAQDMEYTAGVSQLMVYGHASAQASGTALNTRREIDMTRMSLTAENIRNGVLAMAKMWLKLNKKYSVGYRTMLIAGDDDLAGLYTWCSEDINSYDVEFVAENELRHSEQQQREDFMTAYQLGLFTDENGKIPQNVKHRAWELFKTGTLYNDISIEEQQRKNARYEIVQVQNGVIPQDDKYADDAIHLEEHLKFVLSNKYRMMREKTPNLANIIDQHIEKHKANIEAAQQEQMKRAMMMQQQNGVNRQ